MSINADTNADMNLAVVEETYVPNIDNAGNYTDHIPAVNTGIRCACGARKDKVYTRTQFTQHINSLCHKKWIDSLNTNRANYYMESLSQKDIIENQRKIIQQQSNSLQQKSNNLKVKDATIKYLLSQLNRDVDSGKMSLIDM